MLRWTVAFLGLPLLWALGKTLLQGCLIVFGADDGWNESLTFFLYGFGGMFIGYILCHKFLSVTYVFAHEMTHVLVGLLFFAWPTRFEIHQNEGAVELTKTNCVIVLAPYCIPLYFLLAVGLHCLIQWQWPGLMTTSTWIIIYGASLGYHFFYTFESIVTVGQPDLSRYGRLFSYWLILMVNILLATLPLLASKSPEWTLSKQTHHLKENTFQAYEWMVEKIQMQCRRCFGSKEF